MRNVDRLFILPLLAALAIGCSSPTALQTSEYDDVYYSSKDKTVYKTPEAPVATTQPAVTRSSTQSSNPENITSGGDTSIPNPEYSGATSGSASRTTAPVSEEYYSDDYYDEDTYYYSSRIKRFHTPYRGFSYYDFAYTDYYWYNRNPRFYGRVYSDPFYAYNDFLCYPPYGWGYPRYGSGITVIIGGPIYGGYNRGWYSNPYSGGWGNPYYGYRSGYNNGYYNGFYNGYNNGNIYRTDNTVSSSRQVQYGPRTDRSSASSGGSLNSGGSASRPRRESGSTPGPGGVANPSDNRGARVMSSDNNNSVSSPDGSSEPRRPVRRGDNGSVNGSGNQGAVAAPTQLENERPTRGNRVDAKSYEFPNEPVRVEEGQSAPRPRRSSERTPEPSAQPQQQSVPQPEYRPRRESRPTYEAPRQQEPQRPTYEAPRPVSRPEPSYQPPARQEQPRYEAPSRPAPSPSPAPSSGGSSNDGGGSSGRGSRPRD